MMADALMVDSERLAVQYLLARPAMVALIDDRIYTALPNAPQWPALRITRFGGIPPFSKPLYLDEARLQADAFGGSKRMAQQLAETCRAELRDAIVGVHAEGVVTWLTFGAFAYVPDDSFTPARPRYVFTFTLRTHP